MNRNLVTDYSVSCHIEKSILASLINIILFFSEICELRFNISGLFIDTIDNDHVCLCKIHLGRLDLRSPQIQGEEIRFPVDIISFLRKFNEIKSLKCSILDITIDKSGENLFFKSNTKEIFEPRCVKTHFDENERTSYDCFFASIPYAIHSSIPIEKFDDIISSSKLTGESIEIKYQCRFLVIRGEDLHAGFKLSIPVKTNSSPIDEILLSSNSTKYGIKFILHALKYCKSISSHININFLPGNPIHLYFFFGHNSRIDFYLAPRNH